MKSADQLMKKKGFLKTEMDKVVPKEQSDVMWRASTERLHLRNPVPEFSVNEHCAGGTGSFFEDQI